MKKAMLTVLAVVLSANLVTGCKDEPSTITKKAEANPAAAASAAAIAASASANTAALAAANNTTAASKINNDENKMITINLPINYKLFQIIPTGKFGDHLTPNNERFLIVVKPMRYNEFPEDYYVYSDNSKHYKDVHIIEHSNMDESSYNKANNAKK